MSRSGMPPLLIKWSATQVSVFDPANRSIVSGAGLDECLNGNTDGREAVVAIAQRSTFIRTLQVPSLSDEETRRMLSLKLAPLIPLEQGSYVFGYRLGAAQDGQGRTAVVGAVKTSTLRSIERGCTGHGLQVRAIVPLAFGSWLAAREQLVPDGAVVEPDSENLNIDILSGGELRYSRSVPLPPTADDYDDEVARSFEIADVEPGPVISMGEGTGSSLEHLSDPRQIERLLFSLEPPEKAASRRSKGALRAAQRAIVASALAILVAGFAIRGQVATARRSASDQARLASRLEIAKADQKTATSETLAAKDQRDLIRAAFHPAQPFSDVLSAAADKAPKEIWLTGETLERGKPLILRGMATNSRSVAAFVKALNKQPRFQHMKLLSATRTTIGKVPVVEFSVSGHVVGNLPIDRLMREAKKS